MKDSDYGPHESWCDTQNNIRERCNCMASSYIDRIQELESIKTPGRVEHLLKEKDNRIDELEKVLQEIGYEHPPEYFRNCTPAWYIQDRRAIKSKARSVLKGEKK